jgi:hypothetical protein
MTASQVPNPGDESSSDERVILFVCLHGMSIAASPPRFSTTSRRLGGTRSRPVSSLARH